MRQLRDGVSFLMYNIVSQYCKLQCVIHPYTEHLHSENDFEEGGKGRKEEEKKETERKIEKEIDSAASKTETRNAGKWPWIWYIHQELWTSFCLQQRS